MLPGNIHPYETGPGVEMYFADVGGDVYYGHELCIRIYW